MEEYKKDFIDFMVECRVLTFGDFVTKSGRKTPFFINTGNYMTGSQLKKLGEFYAQAIKEHFGEDYNVLFGPAYKGIPISVATSMALYEKYGIEVKYSSNRKEIKDHGDKGMFLGHKPIEGDKVMIIEDVTTAGTSIYETMSLFKSQGNINVIGLIISVDRMEKGQGERSASFELKKKFGLRTYGIVTMEEVVSYLYNKEINGKVLLDYNIKETIEKYYKEYGAKD